MIVEQDEALVGTKISDGLCLMTIAPQCELNRKIYAPDVSSNAAPF